ncbi:hypothetical protein BSZ39_03025 [Bowdeniella nasicola]|uniref:AEC family transporter n=1 Tax=Bowdeniella nasicola TaxID=208480 RepID=A0A1Q5Q4F9_9ACTO|nr:AEC family transporter [Bowdeniella nasicola]OKL54673.1 hypothetical protein BSZ39_03025 [Bowdeniella nasicola]
MIAVVQGLAVIWIVIGIGYLAGRTNLFGDDAEKVFTQLVYYVCVPSLIFLALIEADLRAVIGVPFAVAALSAAATATLVALVARWWLALRGGDLMLTAMSSSLANAGYLGLPLAHYILGSSLHVIPVLLFQVGFFTPLFFVLSDLAASGARISPGRVLRTIARNPIVYAAAFGILISATGVSLPTQVLGPIRLVAGAAVPGILLSFGISLVPRETWQLSGAITPIALATIAKLVGQPLAAFVIARFAFSLSGFELFAVVVMAGLPTAQNAYIAASRSGAGERIAKGAVLLTTLLAIPSLIAIGALLT